MRYINPHKFDERRLLEVLDLDSTVYTDELQGTLESAGGRYKANEEMFIFAVDRADKLCGCVCFFPITDELHEKILTEDTMFDDNIRPEEVAQYAEDRTNNIFIISVAVYPQYRGQGIGFNLIKEMFAYLNTKEKQGYKVGDILAVTASTDGEKLATKFPFKKIRSYDDNCTLVKATL